MWLSQKISARPLAAEMLRRGQVTIGGEQPAVLTDGEEREARVLSPGGFSWRPAPMDPVLISRGEDCCILGRLQDLCGLEPGEVRLHTGAAAISLLPDGSIRFTGRVSINGVLWEESDHAGDDE